jgi:hypothetical protein
MCVDWYGPTKVSEELSASIFTVLHSSWTAVRWRQKTGPNHDTYEYVTYTLRRPTILEFSSENLFQWFPSPVLNLTEIFQGRNVANNVREIHGMYCRQRGVFETQCFLLRQPYSWVVTNVSEEPGASFFRLKELSTAFDLLWAHSASFFVDSFEVLLIYPEDGSSGFFENVVIFQIRLSAFEDSRPDLLNMNDLRKTLRFSVKKCVDQM